MTEHEDPATDYERMLDRLDLDCSVYGCWEPIRAFVTFADGRKVRLCLSHARQQGSELNTEWLES